MVSLKPLSEKNVTSFYHWINDEQVVKYSLSIFSRLKSIDEINSWFNEMLYERDSINLGIYLDEKELIGYAGISNISEYNKSGEYFILIGDKAYWNRGIGTRVTKDVLSIGFRHYGLNRIMLTVLEPNKAGVKAYERSGFRHEGVLRQASFREGKFYDKIIMSILKSEWN